MQITLLHYYVHFIIHLDFVLVFVIFPVKEVEGRKNSFAKNVKNHKVPKTLVIFIFMEKVDVWRCHKKLFFLSLFSSSLGWSPSLK